ncbi:MAG TPA: transglutaminase domain-containing protein [Candidatus Binatia bacterium]|nr:transglutaminase domain-containing protein [Candidatus Binatia bacterium]
MRRRTFLKTAVALPTTAWLSHLAGRLVPALAQPPRFDPRPGPWRSFELTSRVEVLRAAGQTRVWLPVPSVASEYQQPQGDTWSGNASSVRMLKDDRYDATILCAEFKDGETAPVIELVSRVRTRDRAADWSTDSKPASSGAEDLAKWTAPTKLMPIDGIVARTSAEITAGKPTDLEKVQAIYDWTLANTHREPGVRGCGTGDIANMLETRNLGGKCADINALFVGLVRAAGVPARDVYGIRVAPSAFGYRSLGASSATVTRSQHCRAEVYLPGHGWVAMDPADVTKVAREETSESLKIDHPLVETVRPKLFGGWEGNWVAYNLAHDVALPEAKQLGTLGFFMYPQCETAGQARDSLDADQFKYTITATEITA